jgi:hypothetical protein
MNIFNFKSLKYWSIILIGLGFIGTIIFFPVAINSTYTCLYHRIFPDSKHNHHILEDPKLKVIEKDFEGKNLKQSENEDSVQAGLQMSTSRREPDNRSNHYSSGLLRHYIRQYAIFWWVSIFLLGAGYYFYRDNRKRKHIEAR